MVECSFEPRSQIAGKYDVEDAVFLNKLRRNILVSAVIRIE